MESAASRFGRVGSSGVIGTAALLVLALLACKNKPGAASGDGEPPASGNSPGCVKYEPAKVAGNQRGVWKTREDQQVVAIDVSDPGGGLVKVTIGVTGTPTTANVRVKGLTGEANEVGVNVGAGGEKQGGFVFRAQGGQHYELVLKPFVGLADGDNSYSLSWSYEPLVDCYEHNDTKETARKIAVGESVQADAHAGMIAGDGLRVGPALVDFYKFELTAKTKLRLAVTKPDDSALVFEVLDAQDAGLASVDPVGAGGTELVSDDAELEAGTYWVRVAAFVGQATTQDSKEPIPAGWNRPYKFSLQIR